MQTINQKDILKDDQEDTSLKKLIQQSLRILVLLLLVLGVSCGDSTSSGGGGVLFNSDVEDLANNADFNYTTLNYGRVNLRPGITNAAYAIINSTAPSGAITIDETTREIMVASGLAARTYNFQVAVTDNDNDENSYVIERLTLTINRKVITENDFSVSPSSLSLDKSVGYNNTNYGSIIPNSGVTATFEIVNINNLPDKAVVIDEDGNITIETGLEEGEYTFRVEITGSGGYTGKVPFDLTLRVIGSIAIPGFDGIEFKLNEASAEFGYSDFTYGQVTLNNEITADFTVINMSPPNDKITIAENGEITVASGLAAGTYTFQVQVTGTGEYAGRVSLTEEELTLTINRKLITTDDFNLAATRQSAEFGYSDFTYGRVTLNNEITADFTVINTSPQNNKIAVNENGVITVASGLAAGTYTFQVQITGKDNYRGSIQEELRLIITSGAITDSDFTTSITRARAGVGYSSFIYGQVTLTNEVTATYEIVNSTAPSGAITIDATTGVITVASGLAVGTYTFQVQIVGTGDYQGRSADTEELTLMITDRIITKNDFTISSTNESVAIGYSDFTYGRVTFNNEVTADLEIINVSLPNDKITIARNGEITVASGLAVGIYTFQVQVTGTGSYGGVETTEKLTLVIGSKTITNNDFTRPDNVTRATGYTDTSYGRIIANGEVTANFVIVESDAPENVITINPTTGEITVFRGLGNGTYTFSVEITGSGEYEGTVIIDDLKFSVTNNPVIQASDFRVSTTSESAEFGYSRFAYGRVMLNQGVTATFAIVESDAPSGEITIGILNGEITVASGLAAGAYTFKIRLTGLGVYTGAETTEALTLIINDRAITTNDFSLLISNESAEFGYSRFAYGQVMLNQGVTATFAIVESDAPSGEITINPTTGEITVAPNLEIRTYNFQVVVRGTDNYAGEVVIDLEFSVIKIIIQDSDFTFTPISQQNEVFGYANSFIYGRVALNAEVTADFTIDNNNIPDGIITINRDGIITIETGLAAGDYTFQVIVAGTENYQGQVPIDLTLTIDFKAISNVDFNLSISKATLTEEFNYRDLTYGRIMLLNDITADISIKNNPNNAVSVDADGNILVARGLAVGNYNFQLVITGTGSYTGEITAADLTLVIIAELDSSIRNIFSIPNDQATSPPTYLAKPNRVATAIVNGDAHLFTTVQSDNALTVHKIDINGRATIVKSIKDNTLRSPGAVTTVRIGSTTYIYVANETANSISIYNFPDNGDITFNSSVINNSNIFLDTPKDILSYKVLGKNYLFVAAYGDNGIQVFEIANDGTLTPDSQRKTGSFTSPLTLKGIDNGTFYFLHVGFEGDPNKPGSSGVVAYFMTFSSGANQQLMLEDNSQSIIADIDVNNSITQIESFRLGGTDTGTAVMVASTYNDSVKVFLIGSGITPVREHSSFNLPAQGIQGITGMHFVRIGSSDYLLFTGSLSDNVAMYRIQGNGANITFQRVAIAPDEPGEGDRDDGRNDTRKLDNPRGITTVVTGGRRYLFVAGYDDAGISIFRLNP